MLENQLLVTVNDWGYWKAKNTVKGGTTKHNHNSETKQGPVGTS